MNRAESIIMATNDRVTRKNIVRLISGDLSHIGDAIEAGETRLDWEGLEINIATVDFTAGAQLYTRVPQTITTKSVEIPKPISVLPESGVVFMSTMQSSAMYEEISMVSVADGWLKMLLNRGRLHLTAEAAIAHSKADIEAAGGVWE